MRARLLVLLALSAPAPALGLAAGCGDTVVRVDPDEGDGGDDRPDGGGGGSSAGDAGKDALQEYVDPGCPDQPPPLYEFQCDPYDQFNGDCLIGEACYIYVQYPAEPCGQEIYGALCGPAGFGGQGDLCFGGFDCQAGFVCVVTGSGNQCVQLCSLTGEDGCPPGLVCEPIDVEGFGGCL
ncbi:MAG TPA: hypothetical protein VLS89_15265 [Candidatus Nanopelagicales bacterium]|nr:hypothetical protein [Candidatus Nanopelagicales bacterium]